MGGGWRDYAEFLTDPHDRWYFSNHLDEPDYEHDFDEMMEMANTYPDSDEDRQRSRRQKKKCVYCKDSFFKYCPSCPRNKCLSHCTGTLVNHTCILRYYCNVCQKRFATKGELDSGAHKFRTPHDGKEVDCNLWTHSGDTDMAKRIYYTKARKAEMARSFNSGEDPSKKGIANKTPGNKTKASKNKVNCPI